MQAMPGDDDNNDHHQRTNSSSNSNNRNDDDPADQSQDDGWDEERKAAMARLGRVAATMSSASEHSNNTLLNALPMLDDVLEAGRFCHVDFLRAWLELIDRIHGAQIFDIDTASNNNNDNSGTGQRRRFDNLPIIITKVAEDNKNAAESSSSLHDAAFAALSNILAPCWPEGEVPERDLTRDERARLVRLFLGHNLGGAAAMIDRVLWPEYPYSLLHQIAESSLEGLEIVFEEAARAGIAANVNLHDSSNISDNDKNNDIAQPPQHRKIPSALQKALTSWGSCAAKARCLLAHGANPLECDVDFSDTLLLEQEIRWYLTKSPTMEGEELDCIHAFLECSGQWSGS